MNYLHALFVSLSIFMLGQFSLSAQPLNDDLCNATPLIVGASCNGIPNGNNTAATSEMNEPFPFCFFTPGDNSVWFSFVAPASGFVTIDTDIPTANTSLEDTQLGLYELIGGNCASLFNLSQIACDRDGGNLVGFGRAAKMVSVPVNPGTTYYIQVEGNAGLNGDFCIEVEDGTPPPAPSNDNLCDAITLTVNDVCSGLPNGNLIAATMQLNEPFGSCSFTFGTRSVWYRFVVPASGQVLITTNYNIGTNVDSEMGIYSLSGGDCSNLNALTELACKREEMLFFEPQPTYIGAFTPGDTLYVRISSEITFGNYNETDGTFCITVEEIPTSAPINDDACNAIDLQVDGPYLEFDNFNATVQVNEASITPPAGFFEPGTWQAGEEFIDHSIWFTFTAPPFGSLFIDAISFLPLGNFDEQLALYEVGDCSDFSTYTLVNAADENFLDLAFIQQYCLTPGQTYYLMVDGGPDAYQGRLELGLFSNGPNPVGLFSSYVKDPECLGSSTGTILTNPTGGTFEYTYSWSTGDSVQNLIYQLPAGTHSLTVTDGCDSSYTETFVLNDPDPMVALAGIGQTICLGDTVELGSAIPAINGLPFAAENLLSLDLNSSSNSPLMLTYAPRSPENPSASQTSLNGSLYKLDYATGGIIIALQTSFDQLVSFDPNTGISTFINTLTPNKAREFWTGMAFREQDSKVYLMAGEGIAESSYLYSYDLISGSLDLLYEFTELRGPYWLACDTAGLLYAPDFFSDSIFIIDPISGSLDALAETGIFPSTRFDADFDPVSNRLYAMGADGNTAGNNGLFEIDYLGGGAALLGLYSNDRFPTGVAISDEFLAPYLYTWSPSADLDDPSLPNPHAVPSMTGFYTLNVEDDCGNIAIDSVRIVVNDVALALVSSPDNGSNNGTASVSASGGLAPYIFSWSNGELTNTITELAGGWYTVEVIDALGCTKTDSVFVDQNVAIDNPDIGISLLTVYPNPSQGMFHLELTLRTRDDVHLEVLDYTGKLVYEVRHESAIQIEEGIDLHKEAKGVFLLRISTSRGRQFRKLILD